MTAHLPLMWVLGFQTQVFMLKQQALHWLSPGPALLDEDFFLKRFSGSLKQTFLFGLHWPDPVRGVSSFHSRVHLRKHHCPVYRRMLVTEVVKTRAHRASLLGLPPLTGTFY